MSFPIKPGQILVTVPIKRSQKYHAISSCSLGTLALGIHMHAVRKSKLAHAERPRGETMYRCPDQHPLPDV